MTREVIGIVIGATLMAAPAWAEHRTFERLEAGVVAPTGQSVGPAETAVSGGSRDLDLQLKLGGKGFRLGGRVMGPEGVAGAWLNGRLGDRGVYVDGRVQRPDGRAWNFRLDAEVDDWWPRMAWRMMLGHPFPFLDIR